MASITQKTKPAQVANGAPPGALNRSTPHHAAPPPSTGREPHNCIGRRFVEVLLGDPATAKRAYKQRNGLKRFHLEDDPVAASVYGAIGCIVDSKREPTLTATQEELGSWLDDPNTPAPNITRAAIAWLNEIEHFGAPSLNGKSYQTAVEIMTAIKARWKEANPDIDPAEIERESKALKQSSAPKPRPPLELLSIAQIFARPRLDYLIQDLLLERGTSVITADYGAFKSFNILDMSLCVATGKPWHGRAVKQGAVVYVIAEGAYTTADRVRAWLIRYGLPAPSNFFIVETPIQIANDAARSWLIEELREYSPALVMFDTLAKCNVGRDENASEAMGLFTYGMEEVGRELQAHVMAVHHNNKAGNARGSNSLPANVDTHIVLERSAGRVVTFKCDKQKGAPFEPFSLIGRVVELPEMDEYERPVTSLVFEPTEAVAQVPKSDDTRRKILEVLAAAPDGLRATAWQQKVLDQIGCRSSRFYIHRDTLETDGEIFKDGSVWKVAKKSTPLTPLHSTFPEVE
jgi:hypothetical protein